MQYSPSTINFNGEEKNENLQALRKWGFRNQAQPDRNLITFKNPGPPPQDGKLHPDLCGGRLSCVKQQFRIESITNLFKNGKVEVVTRDLRGMLPGLLACSFGAGNNN